MTKRAVILERAAPFAVTAAAALAAFSGMFGRVADLFSEGGAEDMSFGWCIPFVSLYALWCGRKGLKEAAAAEDGGFSPAGFAASVPFVLVAAAGTRGLQVRLEQIAFIGLCITLPWTFFGRRIVRAVAFPALYLVFTISLTALLDPVTVPLRLLASTLSRYILTGIGMDVAQYGTVIVHNGASPFSVDVAAPCAGLRSVFALAALTAAYGYFTQPTFPRRVLLFASSIPLAIAGNVVRILSICLVSASTSREFGTGFYHDYSGYVVFLTAVVLMVAFGGAVDRLYERRGRRT